MCKCAGNDCTVVMKVMGLATPVIFILATLLCQVASNLEDNNVLDKLQFEAAFQGKIICIFTLFR